MAEVVSPQVITREQDVSTVAPAVSTAIAAIVGGALKGPINEPTFISTPDQFVDTFGIPTPNSFLGYAAINFLRNGNQLWVNRIASLSGSDPAAENYTINGANVGLGFATTDTKASMTSVAIPTFGLANNIVFLIDGVSVTASLSPVHTATLTTIVNALNTVFSLSTPVKAVASAVGVTQVKVETVSKAGDFSTISVVSDTLGWFSGVATGARTVVTSEALTPASIDSTNVTATLNTVVVNARATGNVGSTEAIGTLYNVSKLGQEAYGVIDVTENGAGTWTSGSYNSAALTVTSIPAAASTLTFTRSDAGATPYVLTFVSGAAGANQVTIDTPVPSNSGLAAAIAAAVNASTAVSGTLSFKDAGVVATVLGSTVTFTQIHPDSTAASDVNIISSANFGTIVGAATVATNVGTETDGGTSGSYLRVNVPSGVNAAVIEEDGVDYFFMAGADFTVLPSSTSANIATSIAAAISNRVPYDAAKVYALAATSNSNQVTLTTAITAESTGNLIGVYESTSPTIPLDLSALVGGVTLSHGFDARGTYTPATFTIDGDSYVIDYDTVSAALLPSKHEATAAQLVNVINDAVGTTVASVFLDANEHIRVTSPSNGIEGSVAITNSLNIGGQNDPFVDDTVVAGTGDNHFDFTIDDTYTVDVYLTQSATLSLAQAVSEINAAASLVHASLSSVASTDGVVITLTSPTSGSFADFGSKVQVGPNTLSGVFASTVPVYGTGSQIASLTIKAVSTGTWANGTVTVTFSDEDSLFYAANSSKVDVSYNGIVVETYREVVINPDADGSTGTSGQGTFIETAINGVSRYITVDFDDNLLDANPNTLANSVKIVPNTSSLGALPPYSLSGGSDGILGLTDGEVIGVAKDANGTPTGMQVFANTETIFVNLLAAPGFTSQNVGNGLVTVAETRQDTLSFIDPPMGLTASQMVDWHNGQGYGRTSALNTSYACTYNTWLKQYDPYNDIEISLPPSAFLLGQMAYNDSQAEAWFATAGLTRGRLTSANDVISPTTLGDRELLYGQGNRVNPIPKFVQDGIVIWGNRTLYRQESALKEITVRRLLNYVKTTIGLAAKVILFEPNDPQSTQRLVGIVNPVLASVRSRRGLTDFKVVDATTDRDRNLNRVVLKIFIQPTRTIEVIEIPFIITAQGGSFAI